MDVAVRFYREAFSDEPTLADDLTSWTRYNGCCSAVLAAAGHGHDAAKLDDRARTDLRSQALEWLRADLALWNKQAQNPKPPGPSRVRNALRHWRKDPDLASVRDPKALAKLPESEQEAWRTLWSDVEDLLRKASVPAKRREESQPGGSK
jgi:hypothetical protein